MQSLEAHLKAFKNIIQKVIVKKVSNGLNFIEKGDEILYQGSMEEIMERYKQELYNYRQRSKTQEQEPVSDFATRAPLESGPEVMTVSMPEKEAVVSSDIAMAPVSSEEREHAYSRTNVLTMPENIGNINGNPMENPPNITRSDIGVPVEVEGKTTEQEEYELFKEENPGTGTLKVQVYTGRRSIPLAGAAVYVTKDFNGKSRVFFSGVTDGDGIVSGIELHAPSHLESQQPDEEPPYATYDIYVNAAGYRPEAFKDVPIFEGVQSIQPVSMTPNNGEQLPPEITVEEEPDL